MKAIKRFSYYSFLLLLVGFWGSNSMYAQVLSQVEIDKQMQYPWYDVTFQYETPDQQWVSYIKGFIKRSRPLIVKNVNSSKEWELKSSMKNEFIGNDYLINLSSDGVLTVMDLATKLQKRIESCQNFFKIGEKELLLVLKKKQTKNHEIIRYYLGDNKEEIVGADILDYEMNEAKFQLVFHKSNGTEFYDFRNKYKEILCTDNESLISWQWNSFDREITMIKKVKNHFLFEVVNVVNHNTVLRKSLPVLTDSIASVKLVEVAGEKVLLEITKPIKKITQSKEHAEIWRVSDPIIYPLQKIKDEYKPARILVLWNYQNGVTVNYNIEKIPYEALSISKVLLFDDSIYQDYRVLDARINLRLVDLGTFNEKVIVKHFSYNRNNISISPDKKFLAYFLENCWHVFDINKNSDLIVEISPSQSFSELEYFPNKPFAPVQWIDDHLFLINGNNSVWAVDADLNIVTNILVGEKGESIKLIARDSNKIEWKNSKKIWLLKNTLDEITELYYWNGLSTKRSYTTANGIEDIEVKNGKLYFKEQNNNLPPKIINLATNNTANVLIESNTKYKDFRWSKKEVIKYRSEGTDLKGLLYYPVNYNPHVKYPMVVHVYQKRSGKSKKFYLPNLSSQEGFDKDLLTLNGYFVFLPDIEQSVLSPGDSAVRCVVKAVKKVLKMASVDEGSIGLIGHSFGGYETNFIVSKTNVFSAAVSGAGISDPVGWYFSMDWNMNKPEFWRYEDEIFRMGRPFFSNKKKYFSQSPIFRAEHIRTPLLIWTGKEDKHVDWEQSISLHLAMRNLQKSSVLLLYPGEAHALVDLNRASDLTDRVLDWFDHYLKKKEVSWIRVKR